MGNKRGSLAIVSGVFVPSRPRVSLDHANCEGHDELAPPAKGNLVWLCPLKVEALRIGLCDL